MTDLTFVYFKMRALGEAPQMMLHYRNHPYRYVMGWEHFGKPWADAKRGAAHSVLEEKAPSQRRQCDTQRRA